jgi:Holliday junction resolvasome RuvABC DNA-binding subunit
MQLKQGDVAGLKKMPGIGAKSASQIVLDLKGKLDTGRESRQRQPVQINIRQRSMMLWKV